MPPTNASSTVTVPVSNPAHPHHSKWLDALRIALGVIQLAEGIAPAVVAVVQPQDATLAQASANAAQALTNQLSTAIGKG